MEGDASRGFARLLLRLDDATRACYCGDALDEELQGVVAQFRQCAQAMDHAKQVDEATKSLIANAAVGVHLGSTAVAQQLTELEQLQTSIETTVRTLVEAVKDRVAALQAAEVKPRPRVVDVKIETEVEPEKEKKEKEKEKELLETMQSILTEQKGDTWLSDALEVARSLVRVLPQQGMANDDAARKEYSQDDQRIHDIFKQLRRSVLKNFTAHPEDVATFQKVLKRLVKKRPVFRILAERCEEALAAKQAKAAAKPLKDEQSTTKATAETPPSATKSKKRKLSESSEAASAPPRPSPPLPSNASTESTAPTSKSIKAATALSDIRSKAQLCSSKATALGNVFSLSAFDACLKLMIDVVNALTPLFASEDTMLVSATLFVLVDAANEIKVLDKRRDRLVCLESLLSVLLTKARLPWDSTRSKTTAQDKLTACRDAIDALQRHEFSAASSSAAAPSTSTTDGPATKTKKTKKEKPARSHTRFGDEG